MTSRFRTPTATVVVLLLPLLTTEARAQTSGTDIPRTTTTITAGPDSAQVRAPVVPDSVRRTARLFGLRMTKPSKAGLLSALLPGAGQLYNGRWWKVPLAVGIVGGTVYGEILYQQSYREFADALNARIDPDPNTTAETDRTRLLPNSTVERNINVFRRQRDTFVAWIALAYTVQIVDAVVDAHLRDFDISDDLSVQWEPTLLRMPTAAAAPGIGLTFTLK